MSHELSKNKAILLTIIFSKSTNLPGHQNQNGKKFCKKKKKTIFISAYSSKQHQTFSIIVKIDVGENSPAHIFPTYDFSIQFCVAYNNH